MFEPYQPPSLYLPIQKKKIYACIHIYIYMTVLEYYTFIQIQNKIKGKYIFSAVVPFTSSLISGTSNSLSCFILV